MSASSQRHSAYEIASFHTPGHKGRILSPGFESLSRSLLQFDLTELPGLDELSAPAGVIAQLESRAANLWGSGSSLISIGGASSGLAAALVALAADERRKKVFVPRNAHRSIVNGLVLSGLTPVWFEPVWDNDWGMWGSVSPTSLDQLLSQPQAAECCALFLVSPTYAGALSDIEAIANQCQRASLALVVDEAHGAHLLNDFSLPSKAVEYADITVHSLHKTLPGLTQTGLVHVHAQSRIAPTQMRAALNLLNTSSPSYPLMVSIEETINFLESDLGKFRLAQLNELCANLMQRLSKLSSVEIYRSHAGNEPAHMLLRSSALDAAQLQERLQRERIFCEALLGNGILFLLGVGNEPQDVDALISVFETLEQESDSLDGRLRSVHAKPLAEQVLSPRQAYLSAWETVPIEDAIGRIAHECVAPCPPGIPVAIPGQRVHREVMNIESLRSLRVVKETRSDTTE